MAGLRARQERVPRLGVATQPDPNGVLVSMVADGSSAAAAGVRPGDYLIAVGDVPVEDQQFGAQNARAYGASAEGSPLPIKVQARRGDDHAGGQAAVRRRRRRGRSRCRGRAAKPLRIREGILHWADGQVVVGCHPERSEGSAVRRERRSLAAARDDGYRDELRAETRRKRCPRTRRLGRRANQLRHRVQRVVILDRNRQAGDARLECRIRQRLLRRVDQAGSRAG